VQEEATVLAFGDGTIVPSFLYSLAKVAAATPKDPTYELWVLTRESLAVKQTLVYIKATWNS
jgi:hypothetical protein